MVYLVKTTRIDGSTSSSTRLDLPFTATVSTFCAALLFSLSLPRLVSARDSGLDTDALTGAAFYEKGGTLEAVDTSLRFGSGTYTMKKAAYRAVLAAEVGGKAPACRPGLRRPQEDMARSRQAQASSSPHPSPFPLRGEGEDCVRAPIAYRYQNVRLGFTPTGLSWSNPRGETIAIVEGVDRAAGRLIRNGREVEGGDSPHLAGKGLIYENAYGEGLHLGVLTKNQVFRKFVRFDELQNLGAIPREAEFLEVGF